MTKLNEPNKDTYKMYTGNCAEIMPTLIDEKRRPMTFADFMKAVLDSTKSNYDETKMFWLNPIGRYELFGDGIAHHVAGKVKFVLDAPPLLEMTPCSKFDDSGCFILDYGEYERCEGLEITLDALPTYRPYFEDHLTEKLARKSPILKFLARDDRLLKEFLDFNYAGLRKEPKWRRTTLDTSLWKVRSRENVMTRLQINWNHGYLSLMGHPVRSRHDNVIGVSHQNIDEGLGVSPLLETKMENELGWREKVRENLLKYF